MNYSISGMTEDTTENKIRLSTYPPNMERNCGNTTNHRIISNRNNNLKQKILSSTDTASSNEINSITTEEDEFVPQIRWPDTIVQLVLHIGCLYGLILCIFSARFYTILFGKY